MHPRRALADLATLQSRFGRITDLTIGTVRRFDLQPHRALLIRTLCRFGNVRFVLIQPGRAQDPAVRDRPHQAATDSCSYVEVRDLASVIGDLDVLYMTRVQKERFFSEDDYLRLRGTYILDEELQLAKPSMAVLHPLPRVSENRRGRGRRPACRLLRTGQERHARAHGPRKHRGGRRTARIRTAQPKEVQA